MKLVKCVDVGRWPKELKIGKIYICEREDKKHYYINNWGYYKAKFVEIKGSINIARILYADSN